MNQALSVEMANTPTGYGKIHKAGCSDLRDAMPIGEASSLVEAAVIAEDALCWDYDLTEWAYAPCVRLPKI